jgi:hypothetical protein
MDTALGVEARTGWCVVVGLAGDAGAPEVVARERAVLCPDALPRFAYHAAAELPVDQAGPMVEQVRAAASAMAGDVLRTLIADLAPQGHRVVALAVAAGTDRQHDDLASILASHARLHAAEGELYREAVVDGATEVGLPVVRFAKGDAVAELAGELGRDPAALEGTIGGWGKALGPPWRKEHKDAAAAAWLALLRR